LERSSRSYKHTSVKTCSSARSTIFTSLEAKKRAYHSFLGAGRRPRTPGSETKDGLLLTAEAAATVSALEHFPQDSAERAPPVNRTREGP